MIGKALTTVSLWVAAPIWHLYRLARMMPVYGTMGNNQRSETVMVTLFLAAGLLRHVVLSDKTATFGSVLSVLLSLLLWMIIILVLVQGVLKATVRFFPSPQEKKDFIDVATLCAWGCSAVIDLVVSVVIFVLGDPLNDPLSKAVFVLLEIALIVGNVVALRVQAFCSVMDLQHEHREHDARMAHKHWIWRKRLEAEITRKKMKRHR